MELLGVTLSTDLDICCNEYGMAGGQGNVITTVTGWEILYRKGIFADT